MLDEEAQFQWIGNSLSSNNYTYWGNGEPNGDSNTNCVELITLTKYGMVWNGAWNDDACSQSRGSVCEKPQGRFFTKFIYIQLYNFTIYCICIPPCSLYYTCIELPWPNQVCAKVFLPILATPRGKPLEKISYTLNIISKVIR